MLTPLPGSEDWIRAVVAGTPMDEDYNRYDSFHAVWDHPRMSARGVDRRPIEAGLARASTPTGNMIGGPQALQAAPRTAGTCSRTIPLVPLVVRHRAHPPDDRRLIQGAPLRAPAAAGRAPALLPGANSWRSEAWRHLRYGGRFLAEFYRFQHVIYETEFAPVIAARGEQLTGRVHGVRDWFSRTFGGAMTRQWLNNFWKDYGRQRWQLLLNPLKYRWHLSMIPYAISEVVYSARFAWMVVRLARTLVAS